MEPEREDTCWAEISIIFWKCRDFSLKPQDCTTVEVNMDTTLSWMQDHVKSGCAVLDMSLSTASSSNKGIILANKTDSSIKAGSSAGDSFDLLFRPCLPSKSLRQFIPIKELAILCLDRSKRLPWRASDSAIRHGTRCRCREGGSRTAAAVTLAAS